MDYKNASVDIEAGYESVELMKKFVKGTMRPEVLGGLGGFSGAFSLENIKKMEEPILLSGTDGCGTSHIIHTHSHCINTNRVMFVHKESQFHLCAAAICT